MLDIAWPPVIRTGLPQQDRFLGILGLQFFLAVYLHYGASRLRPGLPRFLACLPALAALCIAPLIFNLEAEVLTRCTMLFTMSWLGNNKVLAMCLNRGPLATPTTLAQFIALMYLPIFPQSGGDADAPKGRLHDKAGGPVQLLVQAVAKMGVLGLVVYLITVVQLPVFWKNLCYSFGLVGFLGIIMDGPASVATSLIGLRIIPTFDQPWLSSSMTDFWGRRWNITTSSVLRILFYDPIVEGQLIKETPSSSQPLFATPSTSLASFAGSPMTPSPSFVRVSKEGAEQPAEDVTAGADIAVPTKARTPQWRRICGTFMTFLASGLAHEFIINMLLPALPDGSRPWLGKWTTYFTLQAPLLIAEIKLKRAWRSAGLRPLNVWVARVLTIWFLLVVADPLFFAPVDRDSNLAQLITKRVIEGFQAGQMALEHGLKVFRSSGAARVMDATLHAASAGEL